MLIQILSYNNGLIYILKGIYLGCAKIKKKRQRAEQRNKDKKTKLRPLLLHNNILRNLIAMSAINDIIAIVINKKRMQQESAILSIHYYEITSHRNRSLVLQLFSQQCQLVIVLMSILKK